MYSMWKIMCFLNLKPHKHIALHQIHKIMFFLATSYDPFKITVFYVNIFKNRIYRNVCDAALNFQHHYSSLHPSEIILIC